MQTTKNKIFGFFLTSLSFLFLFGCADPVEQVKQGKSCVDCNLKNADLSGISLVGLDLSESDLSGANLTDAKIGPGTRFTNSNLSNARLQNSQIRGENRDVEWIFNATNLTNANFMGATIQNVMFDDSNLSGANFSSIDARSLRFGDVNLTNATFENTKVTSDVRILDSDLSGANLSNFTLNGRVDNSDFTGATLVNFFPGNIRDPIFPSFDNPSKMIAEMNSVFRKIEISNAAADMLFDVDRGLTYEASGKGKATDIYGEWKRKGFHRGKRYANDQWHKNGVIQLRVLISVSPTHLRDDLSQQVEDVFAADESFTPKSIADMLCGMSKDRALLEFSEYLDNADDKQLLAMMVGELEAGTSYRCSGEKVRNVVDTTLQEYVYDYYNNLIESSGIIECKNEKPTRPLKEQFNNLREYFTDSSSHHHFVLAIISQSLPVFQEEVEAYNNCVNSAYAKFDAGVASIYDSAIRVLIAVNKERFLARMERSSPSKK